MTYQRSKGAALIVSLILLTAVTTVAIVSMEQSSTQVRIVSSSQQSENVFQASMSELEAKIDLAFEDTLPFAQSRFNVQTEGDIAVIDEPTQTANFMPFAMTPEDNYDDNIDVAISVQFDGQHTMGTGNALNEGNSMGIQEVPFILRAASRAGRALANGRRAFSSDQAIKFTYRASTGQQ